MYNYKMTLAYDGSKYNGWQKQSLHPEKTIQGKLEHILSLLFEAPVQVIGSGRTDAGVHAKAQVASFQAPTYMEVGAILDYLKQYLPQDIAIIRLAPASERFHARYNALGKTYAYTLDMGNFADPFKVRFAHHVGQPLAIDKMQTAAAHLIGNHDFKSFTSMKSKTKSTVKMVSSIEFHVEGDFVTIEYSGSGFLQHMVRIISGTLIEVGLGHLSPDAIPAILASATRSEAGPTAPAHALCLQHVNY